MEKAEQSFVTPCDGRSRGGGDDACGILSFGGGGRWNGFSRRSRSIRSCTAARALQPEGTASLSAVEDGVEDAEAVVGQLETDSKENNAASVGAVTGDIQRCGGAPVVKEALWACVRAGVMPHRSLLRPLAGDPKGRSMENTSSSAPEARRQLDEARGKKWRPCPAAGGPLRSGTADPKRRHAGLGRRWVDRLLLRLMNENRSRRVGSSAVVMYGRTPRVPPELRKRTYGNERGRRAAPFPPNGAFVPMLGRHDDTLSPVKQPRPGCPLLSCAPAVLAAQYRQQISQ